MSSRPSRLIRKQEKRNLQRAFVFVCLTIILGISLVVLGIPAMIRFAIFVGNLKSSQTPIQSQDTLPPMPPELNPLPEATNSATIDLHGLSEAGTTIQIFLNGSAGKKVIAEADRSFLINNLSLYEGQNKIYAIAEDKSGNKSQKSKIITINYDNTPPKLTIIQPANQQNFSTHEAKLKIKGQTEEEAKITINGHFVITDSNAKFSYPISLKDGENKIEVVAVDPAGNQTQKEIIVTRE